MSTLVTGASGFVGSAVVRQLLDIGHSVKVLTRPSSDSRNVDGLPVDIVQGDLRDSNSLKYAMQGCDALFHVAADYRLWARDSQVLYDSNVQGTENIMQAALDADVQKIVYTSSVATLGLNADGSSANEDTPVSINDMVGHYKRSKFLAEQRVQQMIAEDNLPAVIVNPSTPVGPRDVKPTPTGKIILDTIAGRMPAYVDTGLNLVHVDDVAQGHLLAFEKGVVGQRYILGNENLSLQQILTKISYIIGKKPPKIKIPHNIAMMIAHCSEAITRLTGGEEPRATVDGVRMSKKHMFFSIEKACQQLGYQPRPVDSALEEAVNWFKANNYV